MIGLYILYGILGALGALIVFMILRAVFTRPKPLPTNYIPSEIDEQEITRILQDAIRIPTVTKYKEGDDQSSFPVYHAFLKKTFPEIFSRAEVTVINKYSLIVKLQGTDESLLPGCFLAHQDVVPAPKEGWDVDPFSGEVIDGYIYGRGAQDMKSQMMTSLYGLELLLREGKEPKRTIYYCFGHDEEFTGKEGARYISEHLEKAGVRFAFVIDEGGTILDGNILGINNNVALIGTCEKGYADFQLTCVKDGGHASTPKKKSSVDAIADAIHDLRRAPMKAYWSKPVKELFHDLAPYMKPIYKFLFVNRDILAPVLKCVLCSISFTNAVMRTTFAFTQMEGSTAVNVIPAKSTAIVNVRINFGQTHEQVKNYMQKVVGKDVKVEIYGSSFEPTPVSKTVGSDVYDQLRSSVSEVYDGFLVAPYPFPASSDSKYYYKVSDNVYRFTPFVYSVDDQKRIHGINERCEIKGLARAARFYRHYIEKTCF